MIKICATPQPLDLIIYIGEDPLNEKVFAYLNTLQRQHSKSLFSDHLVLYPCTIGRKVTAANYFITSQENVLRLL